MEANVKTRGAIGWVLAWCAAGCTGQPGATSVTEAAQLVNAAETVRHWNRIAIDAAGLDDTPVAPGETRTFGEQLGPTRSSRAMAIVHIAIFDSVNAVVGGSNGYTSVHAPRGPIALEAAVAQAAHDT